MPVTDEDEPATTNMLSFKILSPSAAGPRLGQLLKRGISIETPNLLGVTSRGVIPHISHDVLARHVKLRGAYLALEDFIERGIESSPICQTHVSGGHSRLQKFLGFSDQQLLVLGARRNPPVSCPTGNSDDSIYINTSYGFRKVLTDDFTTAVQLLQPDIIVGLGDLSTSAKAGWKRLEKMAGRTEKWTRKLVSELNATSSAKASTSVFAPVLPVKRELQAWYLDALADDLRDHIAGLALYEEDTEIDLPEDLMSLPRLSLADLRTPHHLVNAIAAGMDLFTIPFIGAATDAGIALAFDFSIEAGTAPDGSPRPLGIDMWLTEHATDLSPLIEACQCYACQKHHRAYIQHLLSAKEMLAWVLLQIHNHHVLERFFAAIRNSIAQGSFERDREAFGRTYASEMPDKTGQGPRVRGYQYKSEGPSESRRNARAYKTLGTGANTDEGALPDAASDTMQLQDTGFAARKR